MPAGRIAETEPVLRCKPRCAFAIIAPGGFRILAALDAATLMLGRDLVLTAGTNDHTLGRHATGEAIDVSVAGLGGQQIITLHRFLKQRLGRAFTVLYETPRQPREPSLQEIAYVNAKATGDHLHCQVKRGTTFPPTDSPIVGLVA